MVTITGSGLRRIADYLDVLTQAELDTGIASDGGHIGYALATMDTPGGPSEMLRIVRINLPDSADGEVGPIAYAVEIEVP